MPTTIEADRGESFGEAVKRARGAAGLSLGALGRILSLSPQYLLDVEHGRRKLPPERWAGLCAALPGLTLEGLARAAVAGAGTVPVPVDALTPEQRAEAMAGLLRAAKAA